MALVKTWAFSENLAPTSQDTIEHLCQSFIVQLKEFLVNSGGWTVESSSDSSTFSATDLIGTDLTKLIWALSGNAHSHITLKSPEGVVAGADGTYIGDQSRLWLTIECLPTASATNYHLLSFILHRAAPAGGSITAVPTSANSISYASTQYITSTAITSKFHFAVVSVGENVGGVLKGKGCFIANISNTTSNGITTFLSLIPITNYQQISSKDYAYNTAFKLNYSATSTTATYSFIINNNLGWNNDGTANTTGLHNYYLYNSTAPGVIGLNQTGGSLSLGGKNNTSNIYLYNSITNKTNPIGTVADIEVTGAILTNFSIDDAGSTTMSYLLGGSGVHAWIPSNTTLSA